MVNQRDVPFNIFNNFIPVAIKSPERFIVPDAGDHIENMAGKTHIFRNIELIQTQYIHFPADLFNEEVITT